jgi:hypothetical protein
MIILNKPAGIIYNIRYMPPWLLTLLRKAKKANKGLQKLFEFYGAVRAGLQIGLLSREQIGALDNRYFEDAVKYSSPDYNRQGFFPWEQTAVSKYFSDCRSVLVAAVGGGREAYAFEKMGCLVDAFDCNASLVKFANEFFEKEQMRTKVQLAKRDKVLVTGKIYDGAVVGWGAYMLMQGRENRVGFLKAIRKQLGAGSPLLLSAWVFENEDVGFRQKTIFLIGQPLRWLRRAAPLELGDDLGAFYCHIFTLKKLHEELTAAGFEMLYYETEGFHCIVAKAK